MLTTLAVLLLELAPGIKLTDATEERRLLLGESPEERHRWHLELELRRLEDRRPGLVGPVVMTSVGGGVSLLLLPSMIGVIGGLTSGVYGALSFVGVLLLAYPIVLFIAAAIVCIVGAVMISGRLEERALVDAEVARIERELHEPIGDPAAPSPPPPPPGADRTSLGTGLVLVRF